jgi:hypothetical protein
MRLFEQSTHQTQQNMKFPEGSPNETQNKSLRPSGGEHDRVFGRALCSRAL